MREVPCRDTCNGKCLRVSNKNKIYRCAKTLARTYGVTVGAVYQLLYRYGNTERLGNKRGGRGQHRTPVQFGNHNWPSITAMARDLQVDRSWLGKKLKTDRMAVFVAVDKYERRIAFDQAGDRSPWVHNRSLQL